MKPEFPRVVYSAPKPDGESVGEEEWRRVWEDGRKREEARRAPRPSPAEAARTALATQVRVNVATAWTSLEAAARKAGTGELLEAARQATLAGAFLLNALAEAWLRALLRKP